MHVPSIWVEIEVFVDKSFYTTHTHGEGYSIVIMVVVGFVVVNVVVYGDLLHGLFIFVYLFIFFGLHFTWCVAVIKCVCFLVFDFGCKISVAW